MKISNYKTFLLEWGYGGEGGVASKDPIKVKSSMITDIDLEDDEDDEKEKDIPILKDNMIKESLEELHDEFGKIIIIKIQTPEEYNDLMKFFDQYNIRWTSGRKATYRIFTSSIVYIFLRDHLTFSGEDDFNKKKEYRGITIYTVDEILKYNTDKMRIRWYKKGKFQNE